MQRCGLFSDLPNKKTCPTTYFPPFLSKCRETRPIAPPLLSFDLQIYAIIHHFVNNWGFFLTFLHFNKIIFTKELKFVHIYDYTKGYLTLVFSLHQESTDEKSKENLLINNVYTKKIL